MHGDSNSCRCTTWKIVSETKTSVDAPNLLQHLCVEKEVTKPAIVQADPEAFELKE